MKILILLILFYVENFIFLILSKFEKYLISKYRVDNSIIAKHKFDRIKILTKNLDSLIFIKTIKWIIISSTLIFQILNIYFFNRIDFSLELSIIGIVILTIGYGLRILAIISLKELWSYRIVIQNNHNIIKKGIYKYMKHPAYIGNIYFIGIYFIFNPNPFNNQIMLYLYFIILIVISILVYIFYNQRGRKEILYLELYLGAKYE